MKTYNKPNTDVIYVKLENQLLTISGGSDQLRGGLNGDYTEGITLGSRQGSLFFDDDFDEYFEEDYE